MALKFNSSWRFTPPIGIAPIPGGAIEDINKLINKIATQGERWDILEHFKHFFKRAAGSTSAMRSSNESWAETDLSVAMQDAAENPFLFLEAFFDACESLRQKEQYAVPDAAAINALCEKHKIPLRLDPPHLVFEDSETTIKVSPVLSTLAESAIDIMQKSLSRSDELLLENRPREAVQELLWLLESISTSFKGDTAGGKIQGKYFNEIVKDLKKSYSGTTLQRVLDWITALYGYLSSPTGGGVRHGVDLDTGTPISMNEARLFCNLIRSYLLFFMGEHQRLSSHPKNTDSSPK